MRALLIVTAAVEAATGLALLVSPSAPIWLVFGSGLEAPSGLRVSRIAGAALLCLSRVAGAALLSVGAVCWLARNEGRSRAAAVLVAAMGVYNVAAVALLVYARVGAGLSGIGLWPAVALHAALALWCIACLRTSRAQGTAA